MRWSLLLLLLAAPLAGQHRAGMCLLNMGQLTREDSAYVRSGNMGWEYGCVYGAADVGREGAWYVGMTLAPTTGYSWEKDRNISRWSWRPGYQHARNPVPYDSWHFTWLMPEVGYDLRTPALNFRPHAALIWPVATRYDDWGAPVGPIPAVGLHAIARIGAVDVGVRVQAAHKRSAAWTPLEDRSTPEPGVYPTNAFWVMPVAVTFGVRW